jgi:rhodanese-related sulfurtransferase
MKKSIKDAVILTVFAIVLAFIVNTVSPRGISLVGTWYDNREKQELDIPPSYDPATDSLLTMQEAFNLWETGATFLDAREPEEYDHGHIPGAINLPFDYWDDCWDRVEPLLAPTDTIVAYCGGFDCELSLFTARELKALGYNNALIFFGGINKWEEANLPLEYGSEGTEYEDLPPAEE